MTYGVRLSSRLATPRTVAACLWTLATILLWPAGARAQSLEEERAFQQAAAVADPSIVRIETVGGLDVVGNLLTATGPTTGVVVSDDGYIITSSFNFVSRPASIVVTLADGRRYPAEQIASDRSKMLTLLKIDATGLSPLDPVPASALRVGQWAIALGRTYDAAFPSLSVGIISALDRIWGRAVQTDAKVSPVNYGGPLVDVAGRGIGILVPLSPQGADETAGVEWYDAGIGFAIPLEDVYTVLHRLQAGEELRAGLMGVSFRETGALAGEARIDRVRPGSPADYAGLEVGDVITAVDGRPVERVPHLQHRLGPRYAGETVTLTVRRNDQTLDVPIELVGALVPYESSYLGILPARPPRGDPSSGVTVREVLAGSPAEDAGLVADDVIAAVDERPVDSASALRDRVSRILPGQTVKLTVIRDGNRTPLDVTLSSIPNTLPATLSPAHIPSPPQTPDGQAPPTGRFTTTLPGESQQFWVYVPESYNPHHEYTLLVWLHPASDTMEAALFRALQSHCDERGIILAAPKAAEIGGWTPGESEFVRAVVEHLQTRYAIDPARIALHGFAGGGSFAWLVGFKHRDLFRGLSIASAPLNQPPPENDPDLRLQLHLSCGDDDPLRDRVEQSVTLLKESKYPVTLTTVAGGEAYPAAAVESMVIWLDCLDRI